MVGCGGMCSLETGICPCLRDRVGREMVETGSLFTGKGTSAGAEALETLVWRNRAGDDVLSLSSSGSWGYFPEGLVAAVSLARQCLGVTPSSSCVCGRVCNGGGVQCSIGSVGAYIEYGCQHYSESYAHGRGIPWQMEVSRFPAVPHCS